MNNAPLTLADIPRELEQVAEAIESRNFSLASLCLGKAVAVFAPTATPAGMEPVAQEAFQTDWSAEMHKLIRALDEQNFSLASLCFRKATQSVNQPPTDVTVLDGSAAAAALQDIERTLVGQDFSSLADAVRRFRDALQFPQPTPLEPLEP